MARRSQAREVTLQLLFRQDLNPDSKLEYAEEFIQKSLDDEALREFCWQLFFGVLEHKKVLDARIEEVATNWSLSRMAPTDRNILRLGAYELLHAETPDRVVIDEALELAKKFGDAHSSQFVNGILDRLNPNLADSGGSAAEDSASDGLLG